MFVFHLEKLSLLDVVKSKSAASLPSYGSPSSFYAGVGLRFLSFIAMRLDAAFVSPAPILSRFPPFGARGSPSNRCFGFSRYAVRLRFKPFCIFLKKSV